METGRQHQVMEDKKKGRQRGRETKRGTVGEAASKAPAPMAEAAAAPAATAAAVGVKKTALANKVVGSFPTLAAALLSLR